MCRVLGWIFFLAALICSFALLVVLAVGPRNVDLMALLNYNTTASNETLIFPPNINNTAEYAKYMTQTIMAQLLNIPATILAGFVFVLILLVGCFYR